MKTCTVCKAEKDLAEFGKQKGAKTGLRAACKNCHTKKAKLYADQNKAKIQAYRKLYNATNKDKAGAQCKQYRGRNLDRIKAVNAQWKKDNADLVRVYNQNRKAKKRMQLGRISKDVASTLMALQRGQCANCLTDLLKSGYHLDHIMPIDLGGLHDDHNLQLLCPTCNLRKFNKDPIAWANENGRLL